MGHLTSSIVSYPSRGPWGRWDYRGNTSGYLLVDLIKQYSPKSILDPFSGSGTTRDVAREMGIYCDSFDLHDGFDVLTGTLPARRYDLIFLHPPYYSMIKYSDDPRDLSNAESIGDFMRRLGDIVVRLSEYLTEGGHIVVLIGNMRKAGRYYPLGAYLETMFHEELHEEIIKIQHNTMSSKTMYSSDSFIPIMHEKVLVFANFKPMTWGDLVLRALNELGGTAELSEIYDKLATHPKTLTNPTFRATIRRTLQEVASSMGVGKWTINKAGVPSTGERRSRDVMVKGSEFA